LALPAFAQWSSTERHSVADNNFSDSIDHNIQLLTQTIPVLNQEEFTKAKYAAEQIEALFNKLRRDYPKSRGIACGAAFAVMTIAQRLVESGHKRPSDSRIILPH
jgi:hypothetical protein